MKNKSRLFNIKNRCMEVLYYQLKIMNLIIIIMNVINGKYRKL